jgi:hypothetical protein
MALPCTGKKMSRTKKYDLNLSLTPVMDKNLNSFLFPSKKISYVQIASELMRQYYNFSNEGLP